MDKEVAVPDLAGWRKERLIEVSESHKFTVIPDWICDIYSPSTETFDKEVKMPLYAKIWRELFVAYSSC
jgi:Uma2 family endonuclease